MRYSPTADQLNFRIGRGCFLLEFQPSFSRMPKSAPGSRWSRIILRTVVVLALLGGAGWGGKWVWKQVSPGLFGTKRTDKIPIARARPATISEEIVAVGRLRAVFSTELRSEINGR